MTRRYDAVVGTGGIGTGMFLALEGNRTLGREESRPAELLDQRDYCKLHIVCHYIAALLGPQVDVVTIGKVGDDDPGRALVGEMRAVGLDVSLVGTSPLPTLFSVCFLYPDGHGGNLSTSRSASSDVGPDDIHRASGILATHPGRGIALALPEVPLAARRALLDLATEHDWLRVAALVSDEIETVRDSGLLARVDLLTLNIEEGAALGGVAPDRPVDEVLSAVVSALGEVGSRAHVLLTAGARGSWTWDGHAAVHTPVADPGGAVVNTAGAGDSHLAGVVVGLVAGLDLTAANAFAAVVSALKVRSAHTINPDIDVGAVRRAVADQGVSLPDRLAEVLSWSRTR